MGTRYNEHIDSQHTTWTLGPSIVPRYAQTLIKHTAYIEFIGILFSRVDTVFKNFRWQYFDAFPQHASKLNTFFC